MNSAAGMFLLSSEAGVVRCPRLSDIICLVLHVFAVPVLEVLVDRGSMSRSVLAHHGANTALSVDGTLVQGMIEGARLDLLGRNGLSVCRHVDASVWRVAVRLGRLGQRG